MERGQHAAREEHSAAAEIADEIERRHGPSLRMADRVERAGERDVVDVVARAWRERSVLPPPGHPADDEFRIACEQGGGGEPHALEHAGPEALDQRIGAFDQRQERGDAARTLEVERHRAPAAQHDIVAARKREAELWIGGPIDEENVGAHVGQHHPAERHRADRLELQHLEAGQGSHGGNFTAAAHHALSACGVRGSFGLPACCGAPR